MQRRYPVRASDFLSVEGWAMLTSVALRTALLHSARQTRALPLTLRLILAPGELTMTLDSTNVCYFFLC